METDVRPHLPDGLLAALRADQAYAGVSGEAHVARNRALVAAWDWISICLCLGLSPQGVPRVPGAGGDEHELELRRAGEGWTIDPWPFAERAVELRCEGRRLDGGYADEGALHTALEAAPWVTLDLRLERRG